MRTFTAFSLLFVLMLAIRPANAQEIKFSVTEHDFGNVQYMDTALYKFEFVNTGDAPLLISRVASTCGCTVPTYPHEPIAQGAKGVVSVQYVYTDRLVAFNKQVTVYSNAKKNDIVNLKIQGVVVADKAKADAESKKQKKEDKAGKEEKTEQKE